MTVKGLLCTVFELSVRSRECILFRDLFRFLNLRAVLKVDVGDLSLDLDKIPLLANSAKQTLHECYRHVTLPACQNGNFEEMQISVVYIGDFGSHYCI